MDEIARIDLPNIMRSKACHKLFDVLNADADVSALYVGGCVRDAVIGQEVTDLDVATILVPDQVRNLCRQAGFKVIPTGEEHGTLTVLVDDIPFEVTTLRQDIKTDGRHAKVVFTDNWLEDAMRRDFTMNTLLADEHGRLFDPLGKGLADLKAGSVVFVGKPQERIREDYLRILRFFRFYAYYGRGAADEPSLSACQSEAKNISSLSKERITQEFIKILKSPGVTDVLDLMQRHDILPELISHDHDAAWLSRLGTMQCEQDIVSYLSRLFILFHTDPERIRASEARLIYSNQEKKFLHQLHTAWTDIKDRGDYPLMQMLYEYGRDIALHAYLIYCSYNKLPVSRDFLHSLTQGDIPVFPLGGADLKALGMQEGAGLGRILKEIELWWIAHDFQPDQAACLQKAKDLIG